MTYKKRKLKFQFTLKNGAFDKRGGDVLTIDNVKAELEVGAYGGVTGTTLDARVYGLSLDNMALLSYKGIQLNGAKQNMIKIWADDEPIFFGSIMNCNCDMNKMPDAPLTIMATATGYDQSVVAADFSAKGTVLVVDIITSIAKSIGYAVVNNGVKNVIENPYYSGDPISQIRQCAKDAGIEIDTGLMVISIWPRGGNRDEVKPFISPEHGLIGYPVFNNYGISFSCIYSNLILRGRKLELVTSLPNASGTYTVQAAKHYLSTWTEGGPWMTMGWASIAPLAGGIQ
ncbi:baseplate hub protein [Serratia fonticola]